MVKRAAGSGQRAAGSGQRAAGSGQDYTLAATMCVHGGTRTRTLGHMDVSPIQTRFPGEQYLKTFDAKFQVHRDVPLRTSPFSYDPLPAYRAQVFSRFEASKGIALDVYA